MSADHIAVLQAVTATAAWTNGLLFFRFWHNSRERLFLYFGAAFWFLALSWMLLAVLDPVSEATAYIYAIRLAAFLEQQHRRLDTRIWLKDPARQ